MRFLPRLHAGLLSAAAAGWLAAAGIAPAQAAGDPAGVKRVALVIGNAGYKEGALKNPVNDSRAMSAKLRKLGFEVIERQNANKTQMEAAIADFGETLTAGAVGLFYYAGHGLQVNGRNFLVPVDAAITSEQRVRLQAVDVDLVLDQMEAAKSGVNLVILDACRNNPFERRVRAMGGGLAQIFAPQGTLIAYATAPGRVAVDGDGTNGLYTSTLLQHMDTPGLLVEEVFKRVRVQVARATNNEQTPWESSSLTGSFFFSEPQAPPAAAPDKDTLFWQAVKDSEDPAILETYLGQFPSGTFAPLVRAKLAAAERQRQAAQDQRKPAPAVAASTPMAPTMPAAAPPAPTAAPIQTASVPAEVVIHARPPAPETPSAAAVSDGLDGTWRGSIACGTSSRSWGAGGPFTTYEYLFTVKGGRMHARTAEGELQGTIVANGPVNLSGSRTAALSGASGTLSFQGREENGRIAGKGRWFDRECTLAYVKSR